MGSGSARGRTFWPAFVPDNLDLSVVDRVIRAWEEESFPMARRLAREEGLFVGMSSGAIVHSALEVARELGPGHTVVCIAPDSGARYLTTELFDGPEGSERSDDEWGA